MLLAAVSSAAAADDALLYERFEGRTSGAVHGGVQFVPEVVGYGGISVENRSSARFDGQPKNSIDIGPMVKIETPDFTVEAFVKPEESWTYAAIAADWDEPGDQRSWALVLSPGNGLRFDVMPDGKFYPGNSLTTASRLLRGGAWYHVAAVSQGNVSRVYVNGHLRGEKQRAVPGIFSPARAPEGKAEEPAAASRESGATLGITLGNAPHFAGQPRPFAGMIDEVRITRRALAPHEFLKTRDPMPEPQGPIPEKYELAFTASTPEAALAWQQQARRRLFELVSARAARHSLRERPLDFQVGEPEDRGRYTFSRASFQGNDGQRYSCLWTAPKGAGPFPAVLCLHGHGGSAEAVWDPRQNYGAFAQQLAQGGYCTLTPSFPHRPFAAEALWDLLRCVDLLSARKEVDPQRMGVMGLSMGGEWTMWVAACDERLKAAVISGWMCTTKGVFAVFNCPCWELPGFVELMDVAEVNLLIAPRPVLFESAESDPCFLLRYTLDGFSRIRAGYAVFGAATACVHDVFPGGHMVHGEKAYPFLDRVLGGKAAETRSTPNERR
jgi:acetyl esterase/lipase